MNSSPEGGMFQCSLTKPTEKRAAFQQVATSKSGGTFLGVKTR